MRRGIEFRLDRLKMQIPEGCPACRNWPLVWIMNEDGPEPPNVCARCGCRVVGLVRVYVMVDVDAI